LNQTPLNDWIGRSESTDDTAQLSPALALAATLDHAGGGLAEGAALPPLWHWLYFLPLHRQSQIDADGHARRGSFMPPVPLPRRMWAGSELQFHAPLRIGDKLQRTSTIDDIRDKAGRSGRLVFVRVRHELRRHGEAAPALVEFQDIVYRETQRAGDVAPAPTAAPEGAVWRREIVADPVLLFRYSALTFNGHRIHYDRPYATAQEGYPGLVVHGPLIASLLLDLLGRERPDAEVAAFRFKALRPIFDGRAFRVCGSPAADGKSVPLWAADADGWLAMDASATLR
jgi:3-methylfumaryl-CoA hydratase